METILKNIDDNITFKEIDKLRKPYSVVNTLSMCLKNSIASVLKPDPKFDDQLLDIDEAGVEPSCAEIDNCAGNSKIIKVEQVDPTLN